MDVEFLRGARAEKVVKRHAMQEHMSRAPGLHAWLSRLCHKCADCKALFLVEDCEDAAVELLAILQRFGPCGDETQRPSRCTVATTSDAAMVHLQKLADVTEHVEVDIMSWNLGAMTESPFKPNSFDLVVILSGSQYCKASQVEHALRYQTDSI